MPVLWTHRVFVYYRASRSSILKGPGLKYFYYFQSLGCLLYAMCFYRSPYDDVYSRGDSVALAVQSGSRNVRFPGNCAYSSGLRDLIILMLNAEFRDRPFIDEVVSRVQVLIEANEERLWFTKRYRHFLVFVHLDLKTWDRSSPHFLWSFLLLQGCPKC
jgi:hypothetical protein